MVISPPRHGFVAADAPEGYEASAATGVADVDVPSELVIVDATAWPDVPAVSHGGRWPPPGLRVPRPAVA